MAKTERLIELVKDYPIIFDMSNDEYKNVRKKDKVWEIIGTELKESGDEMKKKWKNLRDTYMRYMKIYKKRTGQAAKSKKKWQWWDQMEAFRPFLEPAKTSSIVAPILESSENTDEQHSDNIYNEDDDRSQVLLVNDSNIDVIKSECDEAQDYTVTNLATIAHTAPSRKRKIITNEPKNTSSIETLINYQNKPEMDEVDLLFLAHARTIKTFTKKRQAIAKMKISQVIMEQELQNIEEQN